MNDKNPTLFLGTDSQDSPTLAFLVDPYTRTFWHPTFDDERDITVEMLEGRIPKLQTLNLKTLPNKSLTCLSLDESDKIDCLPSNGELALCLALSPFCEDLSNAYELYDYADYINRCRVPVANTGMWAVMIESSSQLLPDTFVVNAKTGVFWRGNIVATSLKELDPTLASAESSRRFQSYLENYPTLLKKRFGETHVTVLKDSYGSLTRFYTETDRFIHELKLKEIDNKAEKMTLAEFLEQYCNKENEK